MDALQEKIAAGLFKSLLFGVGHDAIPAAERLIAANGAVDTRLPAIAAHKLPSTAPWVARAKETAKGLLFGHTPLDVIKQRAVAGGLLGRNGVFRSQFALNPEFHEAIQRHKGVLPALMREPKQIPNAISDGLNLGFMAGIPSYALLRAGMRGDTESMKDTLIDNAPWALAGPFGLAGMPLAMAGSKTLRQLTTPKLPQPYDMYEVPGNSDTY